jgi:decaprenyl-phosphate phosphoribosyltransferase
VLTTVGAATEMTQTQLPRRSPIVALFVAIRPRQWLKNILVFAAPLAAGAITQVPVLLDTAGAFVAFCLVSSATYLVNDARDVELDRAHPVKRNRPIAAGQISVPVALGTALMLAVAGLALAWFIRPELAGVVLAYLVCTTAYSLLLKHEPVIELGLLAMGFLLRAIAGGVASELPISQWFLIVAGFGSLFMAAGKRFSELERSTPAETTSTTSTIPTTPRRRSLDGYTVGFLRFTWAIAAAVTISAYCLWAFEVGQSSSNFPWSALTAWSIVPFVLAILRYAVVIDRGRAEAPEDAILSDRVLLALGAAWLVLFTLGVMGQ